MTRAHDPPPHILGSPVLAHIFRPPATVGGTASVGRSEGDGPMSAREDAVRIRAQWPHDYKKRADAQLLSWAMGKPYHEPATDECCPDFSCCIPELFEMDEAKRWRHYRDEMGRDVG